MKGLANMNNSVGNMNNTQEGGSLGTPRGFTLMLTPLEAPIGPEDTKTNRLT